MGRLTARHVDVVVSDERVPGLSMFAALVADV